MNPTRIRNRLGALLAATAGLAAPFAQAADGASTDATANPPGYINLVAAGLVDSSGTVPAYDVVPGATVDTLSIANPHSILRIGQSYTYFVSSQNLAFSGTCTTSFELTQVQDGVTVTLDSGKMDTYACGTETQWGYATNGKVISAPAGPATLTGTVKFGTTAVKMKLPVMILAVGQ